MPSLLKCSSSEVKRDRWPLRGDESAQPVVEGYGEEGGHRYAQGVGEGCHRHAVLAVGTFNPRKM